MEIVSRKRHAGTEINDSGAAPPAPSAWADVARRSRNGFVRMVRHRVFENQAATREALLLSELQEQGTKLEGGSAVCRDAPQRRLIALTPRHHRAAVPGACAGWPDQDRGHRAAVTSAVVR